MLLQKLKSLRHLFLAWLMYWRYGRPARNLIVIGVTGTKGKSTTCRLIASVLEAGGNKVGMLTTVEFQIAEKRWMNDRKMTMLGRGEIQKMLRDMVRAGCRYAVVETSSEGILQYRHYGLHYDVAVFTNLGTEHSERHGGFENLKKDKGKLFRALQYYPKKQIGGKVIEKSIVANTDDPSADYFLQFPADTKIGYCLKNGQGVSGVRSECGKIISVLERQTIFQSNGENYTLNIPGEFNVYNALAAISVGKLFGLSQEQIGTGLKNVSNVAGRMEFVEVGQPFKAIVDYAHEPLSLTALFTTLRQMVKPNNGKIISVIGSDGGGRDVKKRSKMGAIAGQLCDYVVISDVNCFDEDPKNIAEMLASGAREFGKKDGVNLFVVVDRRAGFAKAVSLARPGDVVVVTAKGTEPVLCIANGVKIPWDDRKVLKEELLKLSKRSS